MIKRIFSLCLLVALWSCGNDTDINISEITKETSFIRFDSALFNSDTAMAEEEIERLSSLYPPFFEAGKSKRFWKSQRNDKDQLELYRATQGVLNNFEGLNENLSFSMKHYYYYFPQAPDISFYAYISNLDFDYPIIYAPEPSLCFVGLDLYLGQDKLFYNSQQDYQNYFHQPAFLIRDCMDAILEPLIVRKVESANLLDDMIYYGRRLYLLEKMLPQKEGEIIIQYPQEKLAFCKDNERTIWAYFVENKHLFDTNQDLKRRFIELAPFSKFRMKFDSETPGMIGRWVGWRIVQAYMQNNPSVTLQELGREIDSQKILKLSEYKP